MNSFHNIYLSSQLFGWYYERYRYLIDIDLVWKQISQNMHFFRHSWNSSFIKIKKNLYNIMKSNMKNVLMMISNYVLLHAINFTFASIKSFRNHYIDCHFSLHLLCRVWYHFQLYTVKLPNLEHWTWIGAP